MSSSARAGRRRRLLHEGAAGAQEASASGSSLAAEKGKVRYTPRTDSLSFAVARGVLAMSLVKIACVAAVLAAIVAALVAAPAHDAAGSEGFARLLRSGESSSVAAWWASTLWLVAAGLSVLLFGMRRHRTDDLHGGYRWWLLAALFAIGMSFNATTHTHLMVGGFGASLTGWSPLPGNAFWWFVPALIVPGALALRMLLEMRESPLAATTGLLVMGALLVGWSAEAGLVPESLAETSPLLAARLVTPMAGLTAASLAVLTLALYARRIQLEASGAIAPPEAKKAAEPTAKPAAKATGKRATAETEPVALASQPANKRRAAKQAKRTEEEAPKKPTVWVGGGDDYQDEYEEDQPRRRLSKAERKRLRKLKARNAA